MSSGANANSGSNSTNNSNTNGNTNGNRESDNHVCVVPDSESNLQALFDTVLKPDSKRPLQVPWHMRKMPNSFFTPPSTGSKSPSVQSVSHTRENSADSAFGTTTTSTVLQVNHPRAHSSPASLQQTYASAQQQAPPPQPHAIHNHAKQRSYDMGPRDMMDDLGPLPPGWEQARTPQGQVYYLNHITRTTTWEDPRKALAVQNLQTHQAELRCAVKNNTGPNNTNNASSTPTSNGTTLSLSPSALGALPDGWEQSQTPDGEVYFINHQTRTTSWFDPRIPSSIQRSSGLLPQLEAFLPATAQSFQLTEQKIRLQSLQMERDRLKQRQQEIIRQQELMLRSTELPPGSMDPFLSSLTDHGRQESADSGLGLGTAYSLPQTSQELLDESMDGVSECGGTPDMSALDNGDISTDDLVPSLTLGEDILDDVQELINTTASKPDNVLTWL